MGQKQSSPLNLPEGGETPFINQDLFAKLHEHTNKSIDSRGWTLQILSQLIQCNDEKTIVQLSRQLYRKGCPDILRGLLYAKAMNSGAFHLKNQSFYVQCLEQVFGDNVPIALHDPVPMFSSGIIGIELHMVREAISGYPKDTVKITTAHQISSPHFKNIAQERSKNVTPFSTATNPTTNTNPSTALPPASLSPSVTNTANLFLTNQYAIPPTPPPIPVIQSTPPAANSISPSDVHTSSSSPHFEDDIPPGVSEVLENSALANQLVMQREQFISSSSPLVDTADATSQQTATSGEIDRSDDELSLPDNDLLDHKKNLKVLPRVRTTITTHSRRLSHHAAPVPPPAAANSSPASNEVLQPIRTVSKQSRVSSSPTSAVSKLAPPPLPPMDTRITTLSPSTVPLSARAQVIFSLRSCALYPLLTAHGRFAARRILWCIQKSHSRLEYNPMIPLLVCSLLCHFDEAQTFAFIHLLLVDSDQSSKSAEQVLSKTSGVSSSNTMTLQKFNTDGSLMRLCNLPSGSAHSVGWAGWPRIFIKLQDHMRLVDVTAEILEREVPGMVAKMRTLGVSVRGWISRLQCDAFSHTLPLPVVERILLASVFEGPSVLVRYTLAYFRMCESTILLRAHNASDVSYVMGAIGKSALLDMEVLSYLAFASNTVPVMSSLPFPLFVSRKSTAQTSYERLRRTHERNQQRQEIENDNQNNMTNVSIEDKNNNNNNNNTDNENKTNNNNTAKNNQNNTNLTSSHVLPSPSDERLSNIVNPTGHLSRPSVQTDFHNSADFKLDILKAASVGLPDKNLTRTMLQNTETRNRYCKCDVDSFADVSASPQTNTHQLLARFSAVSTSAPVQSNQPSFGNGMFDSPSFSMSSSFAANHQRQESIASSRRLGGSTQESLFCSKCHLRIKPAEKSHETDEVAICRDSHVAPSRALNTERQFQTSNSRIGSRALGLFMSMFGSGDDASAGQLNNTTSGHNINHDASGSPNFLTLGDATLLNSSANHPNSKLTQVRRQHSIFMTLSAEGPMNLHRPLIIPSLFSNRSFINTKSSIVDNTKEWCFLWTALQGTYRSKSPLLVFDSTRDGMSIASMHRAVLVAAGGDGNESMASRAMLSLQLNNRRSVLAQEAAHRGSIAHDDSIPSIILVKTAGGARFGFFLPFKFRQGNNFSKYTLEHAFAFKLGLKPRIFPWRRNERANSDFILSVSNDHICVGADEPAFWVDGRLHWAVCNPSNSFAGLTEALTLQEAGQTLVERLTTWQKMMKDAKMEEENINKLEARQNINDNSFRLDIKNRKVEEAVGDQPPITEAPTPVNTHTDNTFIVAADCEKKNETHLSVDQFFTDEKKEKKSNSAIDKFLLAQNAEDNFGILGAFEALESDSEGNRTNHPFPERLSTATSINSGENDAPPPPELSCGDEHSKTRLDSEDGREEFYPSAKACLKGNSLLDRPEGIPLSLYTATGLQPPVNLMTSGVANEENRALLAKYSKSAKNININDNKLQHQSNSQKNTSNTNKSDDISVRQMEYELHQRLTRNVLNDVQSDAVNAILSLQGASSAFDISRRQSNTFAPPPPSKAMWRVPEENRREIEEAGAIDETLQATEVKVEEKNTNSASVQSTTNNVGHTARRRSFQGEDKRDFKVASIELFLLENPMGFISIEK